MLFGYPIASEFSTLLPPGCEPGIHDRKDACRYHAGAFPIFRHTPKFGIMPFDKPPKKISSDFVNLGSTAVPAASGWKGKHSGETPALPLIIH